MSYLFSKRAALRALRPRQERVIEELRQSLASGKRRPMLQAPTGFGKTLMAAHIIQRALDKGNSVIFTVPALSLIDQTIAAFGAEPRRRSAEDGERSEPLPRLCDECNAVLPRRATRCPECGALREAKSAVEHIDSGLVQLGSRTKPNLIVGVSERAASYGELQWIARDRGYATGWASHKFKEKFGVWPNDPQIRSAVPAPPSLKTRQWVRSRQIAFAKARAHG